MTHCVSQFRMCGRSLALAPVGREEGDRRPRVLRLVQPSLAGVVKRLLQSPDHLKQQPDGLAQLLRRQVAVLLLMLLLLLCTASMLRCAASSGGRTSSGGCGASP